MIQLQQELEQLKNQLYLQHQKIVELQQKLIELDNGKPSNTAGAKKLRTMEQWSLENFIGLRLIHFVGIIVLVIGLSIGVKYAIDRNLISEMMRIFLAYAAGVILYILSLRLRKKYGLFSAILFSGGMASLYFTTYAAFGYYSMFPFAIAFLIMILLTVYTVYEAISYDRQEIALLGLIGAYAIPFLISKNADRAGLFFLYISLINTGVVFLCIKKIWKNVGRVAQVVTWILFIAWAAIRYQQKIQGIALLFMSYFFLLFLFATISYKLIHRHRLSINDNYQVILNNLALYIGCLFVFGFSVYTDIALISFALCVFTALQSLICFYFWHEESLTTRMLSTLSLIFFVLFVAFNWNGFTVTLLWLLTAVIVFAWGFVRKSVAARMTAIVLIGITLAKLLAFDSATFSTIQKVIAYLILGILLLVVSFFYQKFKQQLFIDDKD